MGFYINVPAGAMGSAPGAKEQWLKENGTELPAVPTRFDEVPGSLVVCLVDNGPFTAAAVAYDQNELVYFRRDRTRREKQWWAVPVDKLVAQCPSFGQFYRATQG